MTFFAVVIAINFLQPLVVDDFVFYNDIRSLGSFGNFVHWYYWNWTGRIQNVIIFFLVFNNGISLVFFNLANSIFFAGLVWLTVSVVLGRKPRISVPGDRLFILVMLFMIWFVIPTLGDCVFWKTGSICYLWPMTFFLLFILPYRLWLGEQNKRGGALESDTGKRKRPLSLAILFLFFGIWVGFSNEQVFAAAGFLVVVWLAIILRQKLYRKVPLYQHAGVAGIIAGGMVQLISPGNYHRMSLQTTGKNISLYRFAEFFYEVYTRIGIRLCIALAVTALLFILLWYLGKSYGDSGVKGVKDMHGEGIQEKRGNHCHTGKNRMVWAGFIWLLASLVSVMPFILLPNFAAIRTSFYPGCFVLLATGCVLKHLVYRIKIPGFNKNSLAASFVIIAILLVDGAAGMQNSYEISREFSNRVNLVEKYKKENAAKGLEVPPITTKPRHTVYIYDMGNDPLHWINRNTAAYYGIDKIRLEQGRSSVCSLQHPVVGKLPVRALLKWLQPFDP